MIFIETITLLASLSTQKKLYSVLSQRHLSIYLMSATLYPKIECPA